MNPVRDNLNMELYQLRKGGIDHEPLSSGGIMFVFNELALTG